MFNNIAFGKISVSAILALGLLGQSLASIIVDEFGWFQMEKVPFSKRKLVGLSFVLLGIFTMITLQEAKQIGAIVVTLLTGLTVVLSRTINAKLAQETSPLKSTAINYVVGFSTALIFVFTAGRGETDFSTFTIPTNIWIYTGGLIGVFTIIILNLTVRKISSFYLTLMLFIGQVFSGIVIDIILTNSFSANNLIGGILVAVGLSLNVWFDRKSQSTQNSKEVQGIPESTS